MLIIHCGKRFYTTRYHLGLKVGSAPFQTDDNLFQKKSGVCQTLVNGGNDE